MNCHVSIQYEQNDTNKKMNYFLVGDFLFVRNLIA